MRQIIFFLSIVGFLSCSTEKQKEDSNVTNQNHEPNIVVKEDEKETKTESPIYSEIVLKENQIDSFSIPFHKKNMLRTLRKHYDPYWVEANIGQQDGPDFIYIDVLRDDNNPVVYFIFNSDNKYKLDEIRIMDSTAVDEYGVRVGDTYDDIIKKRQVNFKNSTNYHAHTYLYTDNSNIYYELTGDFTMTEEMIERLEELELNEKQLKKSTVEYIIWRKRN